MAVIYLRHPVHGAKVATMDMEATYDEGHGWERFDPTVKVDPLDHDMDGKKGGSLPQSGDDVKALRAAYTEKFGKKPFAGWNADTLKQKLA